MQVAALLICLLLTALTSQVQAQPERWELSWREKNSEDTISTSSGEGVSNAEIYVRPEVLQLLHLRNRPIKKHFNTVPAWVLGSEQAKSSVVILLPEGSADNEQVF
ncbi:uncharacterized protein LOC126235928 isoform X1 [Schistocerca nitens]|uniref:uncharacterized protein LOC126235928 isoform X1 n=1 Tax=Schistocerca nitens TaxID=7011 RepID=UPI0021198DA3|nr:uncharacterized protein LOC126235928 isoform X1 [Schistocerca nitens]